MFDFNYNESVGFVPYVSGIKEQNAGNAEEVKKTQKAVKDLSKAVATQSESVAENSAAIADNTAAIADESAAREAAVEELNQKIDEVPKFKIEVVDSLPAEGDSATIYLLKVSEEEGNLYEEYVYSNGAWEKLGPMLDLSGYATKEEMEAALAGVYTKDEVDALIAPLAVKEEVEAALALKADADAVYTKDESDAKFLTEHQDISNLATKTEVEEAVAPLAVKDDVDAALGEKANADDVYTKDEADGKFLTEHQDISNLATKTEVEEGLAVKADADAVYTKEEADAKFLTEHQDISALATKTEVEEGLAVKANAEDVYTKDEADAKFLTEHQDISALATKEEVEEGLATKANADEVYTKNEADAKFLTEHQDISDLATKAEVEAGVAGALAAAGAVASDLANEVSAREQAIADLHEEIVALPKFKILIVEQLPGTGDTATLYLVATGDETGNTYTEYVYVNNAWEEIGTQSLDLSEYAKVEDLDTLSGRVEDMESELASIDEKLIGLAEANALQDEVIATKADADDVYTKAEADAKFLTEHQDISTLATKAEVEAVDAKVEAIDLTPYALSEDVTAEIAAASTLLAAKDAEQDVAIAEINSGLTELDELKANKADVDALIANKEAEIYNLTKIVGDLGGAVTYELPGENGKSFNTLMGNNGTVKLTDDVTTGRFGPGVTAKNTVTLNLNNHNLTVTGLTESSSNPAIMARGTQQITIGGKGTIDAGQGICIEANGTSTLSPLATINLTGSTTVYRTNRSGGELIYCYVGLINITNGTFRNDGENKGFTLNCYDANYRNGTANIVVSSTSKTSGPKFYDFNPADNNAEGEHTNFVAEGCEVQVSTVVEEGVEHTVYMVVKSA